MFGSEPPTQDVRAKEPTSPERIKGHERLGGSNVRAISSPMSPDQQHLSQSNRAAYAMIKQVIHNFRTAVAAGTADLAQATLCLKSSRDIVRVFSKKYAAWNTRVFQNLGIGSMMLNWLWSSGLQDSDEILLDPNFIQPLSFFLAQEGNIEQPMRWFVMLNLKLNSKLYPSELTHGNIKDSMAKLEQSQASLLKSVQHANASPRAKGSYDMYRTAFTPDSLLRGWVSQTIRANQQSILAEVVRITLHNDPNGSLDTGIRIFLQGIAALENSNNLYHPFVLHPAAKLIVSRIERGGVEGQVDPSLYDAFTQTVDLRNRASTLIRATLQLHHPVSPSWILACYHIQSLKPSSIVGMKPSQREKIVRLGLNAAEKMLSHDSTWAARKATKTMSVLEEHFGHELGVLKMCSKTTHEDQKAILNDLEEIFAMTM